MTAQASLTAQLRLRRKGKPGELLLTLGAGCMAIAPFVLAIVANEGQEYDRLKSAGVVAEARIVDHHEREEALSGRRGRERATTNYFVEVRYDLNAATRFADWRTSSKFARSAQPMMTTSEIMVPQSYQQSHPVGAIRPVALLRGDASSLELVEQLEHETSFAYFLRYYLAMAGLFLAGLIMLIAGWRKRTAYGDARG